MSERGGAVSFFSSRRRRRRRKRRRRLSFLSLSLFFFSHQPFPTPSPPTKTEHLRRRLQRPAAPGVAGGREAARLVGYWGSPSFLFFLLLCSTTERRLSGGKNISPSLSAHLSFPSPPPPPPPSNSDLLDVLDVSTLTEDEAVLKAGFFKKVRRRRCFLGRFEGVVVGVLFWGCVCARERPCVWL